MTATEVADRILVLIRLGCVEGAVTLIVKYENNPDVVIALMQGATDQERSWLYYGSHWNSLINRTVMRSGCIVTPVELQWGLARALNKVESRT